MKLESDRYTIKRAGMEVYAEIFGAKMSKED